MIDISCRGARSANGVLRIVICRPEAEKPKKIEIKAA